ncbi:MAG TPA: sterol desaturase family protein [Chitinophagales bacterium]|nr:sterol desaturase family protein [Chitinophagales bacterium]
MEVIKAFSADFIAEALRYLIFASASFLIFWVIFKKKLLHRIIQRKELVQKRMFSEFGFSMLSIAIFSIVGTGIYFGDKWGYTQLYKDPAQYGMVYFVVSFPLALLIHDTYFYFTHRLMHHPKLFRHVHLVHHLSTNPSPWAAYSFHPFEAFIQAGIAPILAFALPLHYSVLIFFGLYQIGYNVMGHLSIEVLPKGFTRSKLSFWHNTVTHHNMHHKYFNCNYTIYYNVWDRIMGTLHPKYDEVFDEVTNRSSTGVAENTITTASSPAASLQHKAE